MTINLKEALLITMLPIGATGIFMYFIAMLPSLISTTCS